MFFALLRRQLVICMYSAFVKNDRRCKAILFNSSYDYDGIVVFEVSSALYIGNYRCRYSLSCIFSKICEMKNTKPMWTWCFIYKLKLTLLFITTNNKDIAFRIANNMFRDATNQETLNKDLKPVAPHIIKSTL